MRSPGLPGFAELIRAGLVRVDLPSARLGRYGRHRAKKWSCRRIKGNASKHRYAVRRRKRQESTRNPPESPMNSPMSERLRSPNFALLLGLAWLVMVAQLLADHWAETAQTLSDMDDAMRLVQVRAFMAGRGWFD